MILDVVCLMVMFKGDFLILPSPMVYILIHIIYIYTVKKWDVSMAISGTDLLEVHEVFTIYMAYARAV